MAESDVQLQTEGTGPHVSTLTVTEPQPADSSGNAVADVVVHQQVITTADKHGDTVDSESLQRAMLLELQGIHETLTLILIALGDT